MFGYILVNPSSLSSIEKSRYRAAYCGLCKELRAYGPEGRASLTYDMTFIALLLNSLYELNETHGVERCAMRPAPSHKYFTSEAMAYAAAMNVMLAYYDELDDWNDDKNRTALSRSRKLEKYLSEIRERWPAQAGRAAECIEYLADMERTNVLNPDEPANCFGALMGELLDWKGEWSSGGDKRSENSDFCAGLRRMGEALGRFIYLLDASSDLRSDIRKERYNPLISQTDTDFEPMLTMLIGECTREFEKLNPQRDIHLLRNVLYSGVWMKYRRRKGTVHD